MKRNGYSLVEVLIAISIMVALFTLGFTNYRDFSRRQSLQNAAGKIQADLRLAQEMALSGQKPTDSNCTGTNSLNGYFFNVINTSTYEIRASCTGVNPPPATKTVNTQSDVQISLVVGTNPILFKVLGSGNNIDAAGAQITLLQGSTNRLIAIDISKGGQIQLNFSATPMPTATPGPTSTPTPTPSPTPGGTPPGCTTVSAPVMNVTQTCNSPSSLTLTGDWNSIAGTSLYRWKVCFETNCSTTPVPKNITVLAPTTTGTWTGTPGTYVVKVRIESSSTCTGVGSFFDVPITNLCN